jgi:cytochrome oxidase Cu insertion factor (SCO1/SenC/PrrC family)
MNAWAVRGWILFAALLALLYGGWISARAVRESGLAPSDSSLPSHNTPAAETDRLVNDFILTDQTGQPFGSAELRGKVWIASFFFASCPATCRQLNQALAGVLAGTPADVMLVSLTCDPDNDTPETLARYGEIFHADPARWRFLTGKMSDLRRVGRDIFQVAFEKGVHSERAFVVDRDGRIRARYSVLDPAQADNLMKFASELSSQTAAGGTAPDPKTPAAETASASAAADPSATAEAKPAEAKPAEAKPAEADPAADASPPAGQQP